MLAAEVVEVIKVVIGQITSCCYFFNLSNFYNHYYIKTPSIPEKDGKLEIIDMRLILI